MSARPREQRGSALVVVLALFAIALGLTTIVTARAMSAAQALVRRERQTLALNAAEAGLAEVAQRLRVDPLLAAAEGEVVTGTWSATISHDYSVIDAHVAVVVINARTVDQARRIRARILVIPSLAIEEPAALRLVSWEGLPGE